jgi:hypothetical protein
MVEPPVTPPPALKMSGETEPALERVSAPPILITEQEVAFSTAAALGTQPRTSRWWIRAIRVIAGTPPDIFDLDGGFAPPAATVLPSTLQLS